MLYLLIYLLKEFSVTVISTGKLRSDTGSYGLFSLCHFHKEKAVLNRLFKASLEEFSDCHASPVSWFLSKSNSTHWSINSHCPFTLENLLQEVSQGPCVKAERPQGVSVSSQKPPSWFSWHANEGYQTAIKLLAENLPSRKGSFGHFKQWQWLPCGTLHTWHLQRLPGALLVLMLSIVHLLKHSVIMLPLAVILQSLLN